MSQSGRLTRQRRAGKFEIYNSHPLSVRLDAGVTNDLAVAGMIGDDFFGEGCGVEVIQLGAGLRTGQTAGIAVPPIMSYTAGAAAG